MPALTVLNGDSNFGQVIVGQMAIAIALRGLFFNGSFSPPIFYVLRKNEENLSSRSLNFLQNAPSNSVQFDLFV